MSIIKHRILKRKFPVINIIIPLTVIFILIILSCVKSGGDPPVIPVWEDNSADSARLNILVQTPQGLIQVDQYVSLALSKDSLGNKLLVRQVKTGLGGIAVFRKLYPRILYYNCVAITNGQTFFGSGSARMLPGMRKDTVLIVH